VTDASQPTSVYRYYDRFGILIYVGITARGTSRNREHYSAKRWWQYVERQEVEHFQDRPAAQAREAALIDSHRPPFNTQHNPQAVEMRRAYEALIASGHAMQASEMVIKECGNLLPLEVVSHDLGSGQIVLRSHLGHASVGALLRHRKLVKAYSEDHRACGTVSKVQQRSLWTFVNAQLKKNIQFDAAFMKVKPIAGSHKNGLNITAIRLAEVDFSDVPFLDRAERTQAARERLGHTAA
jgi:hypothetical protein